MIIKSLFNKSKLLFAFGLFTGSLFAQQAEYVGSLAFDYSGVLNGSFYGSLSDLPDSLSLPEHAAAAGMFQQNDTTHLFIPAFQTADSLTYDLSVIYLRGPDTVLSSGTWDVASGNLIFGFLPGLDSATIAGLMEQLLPDESDSLNLDSLLNIFQTEILANAYAGISGALTLDTLNSDTLGGSFTFTAWQPPFSFLQITNGTLDFHAVTLPPLATENTGFTNQNPGTPNEIAIHSIYPNPFNPRMTLDYSLSKNGPVSITVYNITGKTVATVLSGYQLAGQHRVSWTPYQRASGLYFMRIQSGNSQVIRKIMYIK